MPPSSMIARLSNIVATGLRMKGAERFTGDRSRPKASSCKQEQTPTRARFRFSLAA
jgi:hypothetical protein